MNSKNRLETAPIGKLLFSLAIPTVLAQLVNLLYNIVDRMYVGRIAGEGSLALAGLGVCFPIIMLISAFAALVAMGGAPRASIAMGKKDTDEAEKIMGNCLTMLTVIAIALSIIFFFTKDWILMQFGASVETLPYASSYLSIYLFGTIFVQYALGLNMFITTQGFAKMSMATVCIGAVINIVLDPIFIFTFNMGVQGAALATIISQAVSAIWVVYFLTSKRSILKIKLKNLKLSKIIVLPVLALGVAPFIMQSTECLVQLVFNTSMLKYGNDMYVALMSILFSVMQFIWMPMQGFAQGAQPIMSYNYGAGNLERVKKTFMMLFALCLGFSLLVVSFVLINPSFFIKLFTPDEQLIAIGTEGLRIFMFGMLIMGAQSACQQTFLALNEAKISMFIALLRKIILLIPLALILPNIMNLGTTGVLLAESVSDILAVIVTVILFFFYAKKKFKVEKIEN